MQWLSYTLPRATKLPGLARWGAIACTRKSRRSPRPRSRGLSSLVLPLACFLRECHTRRAEAHLPRPHSPTPCPRLDQLFTLPPPLALETTLDAGAPRPERRLSPIRSHAGGPAQPASSRREHPCVPRTPRKSTSTASRLLGLRQETRLRLARPASLGGEETRSSSVVRSAGTLAAETRATRARERDASSLHLSHSHHSLVLIVVLHSVQSAIVRRVEKTATTGEPFAVLPRFGIRRDTDVSFNRPCSVAHSTLLSSPNLVVRAGAQNNRFAAFTFDTCSSASFRQSLVLCSSLRSAVTLRGFSAFTQSPQTDPSTVFDARSRRPLDVSSLHPRSARLVHPALVHRPVRPIDFLWNSVLGEEEERALVHDVKARIGRRQAGLVSRACSFRCTPPESRS